jgi:hypothetical protein
MLSRPTSGPRGLALALLAGLALGGELQAGSPPSSHSHRPAPKPAARPAAPPAALPALKPGPTKGWPSPVVEYPRPHVPAGLRPTWGTLCRGLPGCVPGQGWYGRFSRGCYLPCNYLYWTHRTYCARYGVEMCYDRVTSGWYYRSARYDCFVPYTCVAMEQQYMPSPCPAPEPAPVPPPAPEPEPEPQPEPVPEPEPAPVPVPQPICVKPVCVQPVCPRPVSVLPVYPRPVCVQPAPRPGCVQPGYPSPRHPGR